MLYNALELPAYWAACRRLRAEMLVEEEKVTYGNHPRQYAIVLRSPESRKDKVAFYFHGGAWTFGRPENFVPAALPWLERGFTVVLPSYRRPPQVGLNHIVADCRRAITAIVPKEKVAELHVGGISAGAHLAALLALQPTWWAEAGWPVTPRKALLCAGPLCLQQLRPVTIFGKYTHLNPYALLEEITTPNLTWQLLHGSADATVPLLHSKLFFKRLVETGQQASLLTIPEGTHLDSGRWMFGEAGAEEVRKFIG